MCRARRFAALRDAITTKDRSACQTEYLPSAGDIYKAQIFIARVTKVRLREGVWNKDKLKASKGCCQSR